MTAINRHDADPVLLGTPGSLEQLTEVSSLTRFGVGAMGVLALLATAAIYLGGDADALPDYHPLPVVLLGLAALATAAVARIYPPLLSPGALRYLMPVGMLSVGAAAYFATIELSPYAAMFLSWSGTAVAFHRRRTAFLMVLFASAVEVALVLAQPGNAIPVARWQAMFLLTLTFGAGLDRLAKRAHALAAGEFEARSDAEQSRAALEVVSEERSQFLASMSHQLRTPLNAIIGFSDVLVQRHMGDLNEKQAEYATDIVDSGHHLLALVDDLLDLAKVEAGVLELELRRVDVDRVVRSSVSLFKEQAGRRNIILTLDIAPSIGSVEADERKVRQVLFNLLSNAIKFTPHGGEIAVRVEPVQDAVVLSVEDTGPGIPVDQQGAIFEEFHQAGQTAGGTGLGLPLARKLVERHGGRLTLESDGRDGSTFRALFPRRPRIEFEPAPTAPPEPPAPARVLLGELDSPERRFETGRSMLLVGLGITVTAAISTLAFNLHPVREYTELSHPQLWNGLILVSAVLCVFLWRFPRQMSAPEVLPVYLPLLTVVFGIATYALGAVFAPFAIIASAALPIAGGLFSRKIGAISVALSAAMYGIIFAIQPHNVAPVARWVLATGFAGVTSLLYSRFIFRITLLAEAERAAKEDADHMAEALAVASRHKTEFLANMSHELRTPLNAIIGFSEVLASEAFGPLNTKQHEYIDDVHTAGRHLLDLINDILDLAKIEAGRMDLEAHPMDVRGVIDDTITRFYIDAESRSVVVDVDLGSGLGTIEADEGKLRRVLTSLLSNAVKYAPIGGDVALRASRETAGVKVVVFDNGPGIRPEEQDRIFEAFTASGPGQGSGVGLALARRYVELHGGTLDVESAPGAGATFTMRLPAAPPSSNGEEVGRVQIEGLGAVP